MFDDVLKMAAGRCVINLTLRLSCTIHQKERIIAAMSLSTCPTHGLLVKITS